MKLFILKLLNRLPFLKWKFAIVTKAWADELARGKSGIGEIVRVWHEPFNFPDYGEPAWLLYPVDHFRMKKIMGVTDDRMPFYLDQAIEVIS